MIWGRRSPAALAVLTILLMSACAVAAPADPPATAIPPLATAGPAAAAAAALVDAQLAKAGLALVTSPVEHRPGEPAVIQDAPRAVYRVNLANPNEGWVLIYDLSSADAAHRAGEAFAAYLGSGVGQTNYPRDAQFALSRAGSALVFSWWSRERSSDPARAEAAFDAIGGAGEEIPVRR